MVESWDESVERECPEGAAAPPECGPAAAPSVAIVEDHQLLSAAISTALRSDGHQVWVPALTDLGEVSDELARHRPDVALLDLDLGSFGSGEDLLPTLTSLGTRVLVVSGTNDDWRVGRCLDSGAWGWVPKSADIGDLLEAIRRAGSGEAVIGADEREDLLMAWRLRQTAVSEALGPFERLTRREASVLGMLMDGLPVERIAAGSYVSVATVRTQVRAILQKLGVSSQLEAVARANRAGWTPGRPVAD